ncbi:MAG: glycosyltransferase family 4 protein [Bacteroidetes bacterium]|nr:glycosyltransferase family 4 protein [Bacteroidota bacterium]
MMVKKNYIPKKADAEIAFCFPNPNGDFYKNVKRKIYWVPDLQEKHYPSFFTEEEILARNAFYNELAQNQDEVVFSSESSKQDFFHFFPDAKIKPHVIKFAVTHASFAHIDFEEVRKKFALPSNYFICPNQFWVHKNHKVVVEAIAQLNVEGIAANVVFTGKEHDYRNPAYTDDIKKLAAESGHPDAFRFLGFIDRSEQLVIMQHATALIQPSLSEGWSTTIEDALSLEKWVICSDIPANKEQVHENVSFFEATNPIQLAEILKTFANKKIPPRKENYSERVQQFGNEFIRLI